MQSDEKYSQYWKDNIKSDESGKFTDPDLESEYQKYATARDRINEAKSPNKLKALNETVYKDYTPIATVGDKAPESEEEVSGDPIKSVGRTIDPHQSNESLAQKEMLASLKWMKRLLNTGELSSGPTSTERSTPYWKAVLDKYGERYDSELGAMNDPKAFWTQERVKGMDEWTGKIPDVTRLDGGLKYYNEDNIDSLAKALGIRPTLLRKYIVNARDNDKDLLGIPLYEGYLNMPISPFAPWAVDKKGVPLNVDLYNMLDRARDNGFFQEVHNTYPDKNNLYKRRFSRWLEHNAFDENGNYRIQAPYAPGETPAPKPKKIRVKVKKEEAKDASAPSETPEETPKDNSEDKPKAESKEKPKKLDRRGMKAARALAQKYGALKEPQDKEKGKS